MDVALPLPFRQEVEFLLDHLIQIGHKELSGAIAVSDMFVIEKGDTGLTEAMIYRELDLEKGFAVYGGGSGAPRFRATKALQRADGSAATLFKGPALVVSMDGSAGSVHYVEGKFYCNHHGSVLKLKTEMKGANLLCVSQLIEPHLKRAASNKGASGTVTMPALRGLKFSLPMNEEVAQSIAEGRASLMRLSRLFR